MYTQKQAQMIAKAIRDFEFNDGKPIDLRKYRDWDVRNWMLRSGLAEVKNDRFYFCKWESVKEKLGGDLWLSIPSRSIFEFMREEIEKTKSPKLLESYKWNLMFVERDSDKMILMREFAKRGFISFAAQGNIWKVKILI